MVDCSVITPNSLMVFVGDTPVNTITTSDTVDVYVSLPEFPNQEWKLFDMQRGKLTEVPLILDDKGCGKYTVQFAEGIYNIRGTVCRLWWGDRCVTPAERDTNTIALTVKEPPPVVEPPTTTVPPTTTTECGANTIKLPYFGCVDKNTAILYGIVGYGGLYLLVRGMSGKRKRGRY